MRLSFLNNFGNTLVEWFGDRGVKPWESDRISEDSNLNVIKVGVVVGS